MINNTLSSSKCVIDEICRNFRYEIALQSGISKTITNNAGNTFAVGGGSLETSDSSYHTDDVVDYKVNITTTGYPKIFADKCLFVFGTTLDIAIYEILKNNNLWFDSNWDSLTNKQIKDIYPDSPYSLKWWSDSTYRGLIEYSHYIDTVGAYPLLKKESDVTHNANENIYFKLKPKFHTVANYLASSTLPGYPASNAFDSSYSTYWQTNSNLQITDPRWIAFDLGSDKDVNYFEIYWYSLSYAGNFDIYAAPDGSAGMVDGAHWIKVSPEPGPIVLNSTNPLFEYYGTGQSPLARICFPTVQTYRYWRIYIPANEAFHFTYSIITNMEIGLVPQLTIGDWFNINYNYNISNYTIGGTAGVIPMVANGSNKNNSIFKGFPSSTGEEKIQPETTGNIKVRGNYITNETVDLFIEIDGDVILQTGNHVDFNWWINSGVPTADIFNFGDTWNNLGATGLQINLANGVYKDNNLIKIPVFGDNSSISLMVWPNISNSASGYIQSISDEAKIVDELNQINYRLATLSDNVDELKVRQHFMAIPNPISRKIGARSDHKILYTISDNKIIGEISNPQTYKINSGWNIYNNELDYNKIENTETDIQTSPGGYIHWKGALDPYNHILNYKLILGAWYYENGPSDLIENIENSVQDSSEVSGVYYVNLINPTQCTVTLNSVVIRTVTIALDTINTNIIPGLRIKLKSSALVGNNAIVYLLDRQEFNTVDINDINYFEWLNPVTLQYESIPTGIEIQTINSFDDGILHDWTAPLSSIAAKDETITTFNDNFDTIPDVPPSNGTMNSNYWKTYLSDILKQNIGPELWSPSLIVDPYPIYDHIMYMNNGNVGYGRYVNSIAGNGVARDRYFYGTTGAWSSPETAKIEILNTPFINGERLLKIRSQELDITQTTIDVYSKASNYISSGTTVTIIPNEPKNIIIEYKTVNEITAGSTVEMRITLTDTYGNRILNSNLLAKVSIYGEPDKIIHSGTTVTSNGTNMITTGVLINNGYLDIVFRAEKKGEYLIKPYIEGLSLISSTAYIYNKPAAPDKITVNVDRNGSSIGLGFFTYINVIKDMRVEIRDSYDNIVENIGSYSHGTEIIASAPGWTTLPTFVGGDTKNFPTGIGVEAIINFSVQNSSEGSGNIRFAWWTKTQNYFIGDIDNSNSQAVFVGVTNIGIEDGSKVGYIYIRNYNGVMSPSHLGKTIQFQTVGNIEVISSGTIVEEKSGNTTIGYTTIGYYCPFSYKVYKPSEVGELNMIYCYCTDLLASNCIKLTIPSAVTRNLAIKTTLTNSKLYASNSITLEARVFDYNWNFRKTDINTYVSLNTLSSARNISGNGYVNNGIINFTIRNDKAELAIINVQGSTNNFNCLISCMPYNLGNRTIELKEIPHGAPNGQKFGVVGRILDSYNNVVYTIMPWGLSTGLTYNAINISVTNCTSIDITNSVITSITPSNGFFKFYYTTINSNVTGQIGLSGTSYISASKNFDIYDIGDNKAIVNPNDDSITIKAGNDYELLIESQTDLGVKILDSNTLVSLVMEKNSTYVYDIEINNLILETRFKVLRHGNIPSYTGADGYWYGLTGSNFQAKILCIGSESLVNMKNSYNYTISGSSREISDAKGLIFWLDTQMGVASTAFGSSFGLAYYYNNSTYNLNPKFKITENFQWNKWIKLKIIINNNFISALIDDSESLTQDNWRLFGGSSMHIDEVNQIPSGKVYVSTDLTYDKDTLPPELLIDYYKISSNADKVYTNGDLGILHTQTKTVERIGLSNWQVGSLEGTTRANFRHIRQKSTINMDLYSKDFHDEALLIKGDNEEFNYGYRIRIRSAGNNVSQLWIEKKQMPKYFNPNLYSYDSTSLGWKKMAYCNIKAHTVSNYVYPGEGAILVPHTVYNLFIDIDNKQFTVQLKEKSSAIIIAEINLPVDDYQEMWDNNFIAFETYGVHLHIDNLEVIEPRVADGVEPEISMRFQLPGNIMTDTYYYWQVKPTDLEES